MPVDPELRTLQIDIPARPESLVQLSLLMADDDMNLQAASHLIEGDMALAAAVMKAVNSSLYGLKGRVQSVQQAITYLGMREVSAIAFEIATRMAMREAFDQAGAVLLEPIMKVEVITPEEYMGDVIGDLNRRRGQIQGMEDSISGKVVTAEVPLAEMFGYATSVRSMSQGRATFTMEFAKYLEVPNNVAEAVMKKAS